MKVLATLVGKETRALFASPIAYAVIAVLVVWVVTNPASAAAAVTSGMP